MVVSIINNSTAQIAQRSVQKNSEETQRSISKISSGVRVFKASEDASALAIGTGLKVELSALRAASLNVQQGASMLQTADGALAQIQDILVRMKTLAQTAASGQIGNADIDSLHRPAIAEIATCEQRARRAEAPPEVVLAARFARNVR